MRNAVVVDEIAESGDDRVVGLGFSFEGFESEFMAPANNVVVVIELADPNPEIGYFVSSVLFCLDPMIRKMHSLIRRCCIVIGYDCESPATTTHKERAVKQQFLIHVIVDEQDMVDPTRKSRNRLRVRIEVVHGQTR